MQAVQKHQVTIERHRDGYMFYVYSLGKSTPMLNPHLRGGQYPTPAWKFKTAAEAEVELRKYFGDDVIEVVGIKDHLVLSR